MDCLDRDDSPYLKLDHAVLQPALLSEERRSDGGRCVLVKVVGTEPEDKGGLSHSRLACVRQPYSL